MGNKSVVVFDANALHKEILDKFVNAQTNLLIDYAMQEIDKIGKEIENNTGKAHHMDRTGNLLDSLCWGVAYRGELKSSGFYRQPMASMSSGLHEWFKAETRSKYDPYGTKGLPWEKLGSEELPEVWGHDMAQHYIDTYGRRWSDRGWRMFLAICAPYWGFWERGFSLHHGFSVERDENGEIKFIGASFMKFAVMSRFYDEVRADLKPARTRLSITNVSYTNTQLAKKAKRSLYKGKR